MSPCGSSRAALRSSNVAATTRNDVVCSRSIFGSAFLMCEMNSSVTWDRATSVMSSLCFAIRLSNRSNGPSKLTRRTENPGVDDARRSRRHRDSSLGSHGRHQGPISRCTRTLSSPFCSKSASAMATASRTSRPRSTANPCVRRNDQPGVLDLEQLIGGHVDRHLLVVAHAAAGPLLLRAPVLRRILRFDGAESRTIDSPHASCCGRRRAEEVIGGRQAHSPRQRANTSLASCR